MIESPFSILLAGKLSNRTILSTSGQVGCGRVLTAPDAVCPIGCNVLCYENYFPLIVDIKV